MKKIIAAGLIFLLLITNTAYGIDSINSKSCILVEESTGRILYSKNKDDVLPQASITKLMTYLVFKDYMKEKNLSYNNIVITKNWNLPDDGSKLGFEGGQKLTIKQLLNSLLILSANDSALELQSIYESSGKSFIEAMNKKAENLGLSNSRYYNSTGLSDDNGIIPDNHTTVYETSKLAIDILKEYPETINITTNRKYNYNGKTYYSTNPILKIKNKADGLKTGHTDNAGYCLAATEKVGDADPFRVIAIVFGCKSNKDRINDCLSLLKYAENNFENEKIVNHDKVFDFKNEYYKGGHIKAVTLDDVYIFKGKNEKIIETAELNKLDSKIKKNDIIGKLILKNTADGKTIEKNLYAESDFREVSIFQRIFIFLKHLVSKLI